MRTVRRTSTAVAVCTGLALTLIPTLVPAANAQAPAATAAAVAAPSSPSVLQAGSRGSQVREWQALLNRIFRAGAVVAKPVAEDGVYGAASERATRVVQAHLRLRQDGVVGPRTRSAVAELGFAIGAGGTRPSNGAPDQDRRLRAGMRGDDVREWQRIINVAIGLGRLDRPRLAQNGTFGPQTRSATIALQKKLKVTADGVVGPATRQATGWLLEG